MTTPRAKTFSELTEGYAAAVQASASGLVDFTPGSVLRACGEAIAQVVLWLQALLLQIIASTRASTSEGADLDSWMADWGLARLAATKAAGNVTFSRFTTTATGLVPRGAVVASADGSQQYEVIKDAGNAAWNNGLDGYSLAIGVASVTVPVRALTPGAAGNAIAGKVKSIVAALTGIDKVTNAAAFTGGSDDESDPAFRLRFKAYLASLSRGTRAAIGYAISQVQPGLDYTITENKNTNGTDNEGFFYVVVDDGSGAPSNALVDDVTAAVDAVRPVCTAFTVIKPTKLTATVSMKFAAKPGYVPNRVKNHISAAVVAYINSLKLGDGLSYSRLIQVAYDASPGVADVSNVVLNSGTANLAGTAKQVIRTSSGSVTVTKL